MKRSAALALLLSLSLGAVTPPEDELRPGPAPVVPAPVPQPFEGDVIPFTEGRAGSLVTVPCRDRDLAGVRLGGVVLPFEVDPQSDRPLASIPIPGDTRPGRYLLVMEGRGETWDELLVEVRGEDAEDEAEPDAVRNLGEQFAGNDLPEGSPRLERLPDPSEFLAIPDEPEPAAGAVLPDALRVLGALPLGPLQFSEPS